MSMHIPFHTACTANRIRWSLIPSLFHETCKLGHLRMVSLARLCQTNPFVIGTCPCLSSFGRVPWTLDDEFCRNYNIFPIFRKKDMGML